MSEVKSTQAPKTKTKKADNVTQENTNKNTAKKTSTAAKKSVVVAPEVTAVPVGKVEPVKKASKRPASTRAVLVEEQVSSKPVEKSKAPVAKKSTEAAKVSTREVGKVFGEEILLNRKKILFVASEVRPFAASGGMGEVMGSLPATIAENKSYDVRVAMPLYEAIAEEYRSKMTFVGFTYVPVAWRSQYCGVFSLKEHGVTYYFLDNEYYFKRPNLYGYYDDGERFAFFSRALMEILPLIDYVPNVIACNDWQTALVPVYYKLFYQTRDGFEGIKTTFTIHNIEYQGVYPESLIEELFGLPAHELLSVSHNGNINLMKAAIDYSETINTVSPTYAQEILHPFYAHGLEHILSKNSWKLRGILNGIDTVGYNPETDKSLFANYSVKTLKNKKKNKTDLQAMLNLPVSENTPMLAIISRLVTHKGMDLVKYVAEEILQNDVQLVVLGTGDSHYENYFSHIEAVYNNKVRAIISFNSDLARKIYAAADIFVMPSKSEPCGLSQMIAARYGTVPVVRETGGLYDSIKDCGDGKDSGIGFTFAAYNSNELLHALNRAIFMYKDYNDIFQLVAKRAMQVDFSWKLSAQEYIKMFNELT